MERQYHLNRRNKMIKIAICDDDKHIVMVIEKILKEYFEAKGISYLIKTFLSGNHLLSVNIRFQIIFLDIEMKPINGIETAMKLRKKDIYSKIIYITNYSGYKSNAFEVHAFDYIDKPIRKERIIDVVKAAIKYLEILKPINTYTFKTDAEQIKVDLDSIYYFECYMRKVKIVTDNATYYSSYKLKDIKEKLNDYGFLSTHKSYVVNMLHITKMKGFEITMYNGDILPLSQKNSHEIKNRFNSFLQSTYKMI